MASHALLLRLFLSPSFFSLHLALNYLRLYADNIGITYYLTRRLRELDVHQLYDVWGFIWSSSSLRPPSPLLTPPAAIFSSLAPQSPGPSRSLLWRQPSTLHTLP
jgi:hypothetical protein